jgi:hypothetical protein
MYCCSNIQINCEQTSVFIVHFCCQETIKQKGNHMLSVLLQTTMTKLNFRNSMRTRMKLKLYFMNGAMYVQSIMEEKVIAQKQLFFSGI